MNAPKMKEITINHFLKRANVSIGTILNLDNRNTTVGT